jgi:hypothetical protein
MDANDHVHADAIDHRQATSPTREPADIEGGVGLNELPSEQIFDVFRLTFYMMDIM